MLLLVLCRLYADETSVEYWLDLTSDSHLLVKVESIDLGMLETSAEDWLDLLSNPFQQMNKRQPSPGQIRPEMTMSREKTLLGALNCNALIFYEPRISLRKCPKSMNLCEIIPEQPMTEEVIAFSMGLLSLIAKTIIAHGTEMINCTLHPKKIYIKTFHEVSTITFHPQETPRASFYSEKCFWSVSREPREAFAYLMFYIIFPEIRRSFDAGLSCIIRKNLCEFSYKEHDYIPVCLYRWRNPGHTTFLSTFKACAISLFYKKITMEDIVTYLDNWQIFNTFYDVIKAGVINFYPRDRDVARRYIIEFRQQEFRKYTEMLSLMKKVSQKWFNGFMLLWLVEDPLSDCEKKFKRLYSSEELAQRKFLKAIDFLSYFCRPHKDLPSRIMLLPNADSRTKVLEERAKKIRKHLENLPEEPEDSQLEVQEKD